MPEHNANPPLADLSVTQRRHMVDGQIRTYDVNDPALLDAFYELPREAFLPANLRPIAYADCPVSVSGNEKRELLVPMVLARMIQAAAVKPGCRVLDVAGGSGYSAAVFAKLGAQVTALESDPALSEEIAANCGRLGLTGVEAVTGPLPQGWPQAAPYDVIFINGSIEQRPESLFDQLAQDGRLLAVDMATANRPARSAKATVFVRTGPYVSARPIFDACAPLLSAFRRTAEFVF
jgi:protein-L-isoaspartate(D-aspartate) O-methyltransferase